MNIQRMQQLIRVLQEVEANGKPFDISDWFGIGNPHNCKTTACAAGWACRDPWMEKRGLKTDEEWHAPRFGNAIGMQALELFFGLTWYQTCELFSPLYYDTGRHTLPRHVIARINSMLMPNENGV